MGAGRDIELHMRLLQAERDDLLPMLLDASPLDFDRTTVCDGWSVRDVVAHCATVLLDAAAGRPRRLDRAENQADVDALRHASLAEVIKELERAYDLAIRTALTAPVALAAWIHGGDIRDGLNLPGAYRGPALAEALELLARRSVEQQAPPVDVTLADAADYDADVGQLCLGDPSAPAVGWLRVDPAGLFRLVAGRRVNLVEYDLVGVTLDALRLYR